MKSRRACVLGRRHWAAGLALAAIWGWAGEAGAEDAAEPWITPILEGRLRYEFVDQVGPPKEANAVTARVRFGAQTRSYYGFSALVEGEWVQGLNRSYNSTTNGRSMYPVVADPNNIELNRAQLTYKRGGVKAVVGRQRIIFDNARFVGNVGWRQNEQTFDSALGAYSGIPGLTATYAYVDKVQRILGNESAAGDFESDSHLVNLKYTGIEDLTLGAYAYLLDLDDVLVLSTQTYGVSASYKAKLGEKLALKVGGEFATQSDYGSNPRDIDLDYYAATVGAKYAGFDASLAYEVLEGDGTSGFSTPLATLHKFQGWADVFLTTPAAGIEDLYGRIGYASGKVGPFKKIIAAAIYHDFEAEQGGADLGDEIDLLLKGVITPKVSVTAKYATYDGPSGGPADRDKLWLQVDFKL